MALVTLGVSSPAFPTGFSHGSGSSPRFCCTEISGPRGLAPWSSLQAVHRRGACFTCCGFSLPNCHSGFQSSACHGRMLHCGFTSPESFINRLSFNPPQSRLSFTFSFCSITVGFLCFSHGMRKQRNCERGCSISI